ncbi:cation:proton antiporter [Luteolibacter sp. GHJ8]|uniref:Cation:proton antiporter n=1 Tax=Luteolibacter rhizosphaerae TaxID=2989719 RepID=A0ABT3FXX8_9BACT|nr:cation:proton antiporter [Luteolibacter rhizosphaerae]MCW1912424.1 cation:proton antiporter [Luteolibacter rhizosphaerae]
MLVFSVLAAGAADVSPLFGVISMVLLMAVLMALLLHRLKQNFLVGYMICGIIIANTSLLGSFGSADTQMDGVIAHLAEMGVILLMFTLGIEFSLGELKHLWRVSLIGGGIQVGTISAIGGAICWFCGIRPASEVVVLAVSVALSSTAVAMKSFQDMGQPNNPSARTALAIALFDDIVVILFLIILPALFGKGEGSIGGDIALALGKGILFLGGTMLLGRYGITPLLHAVARTRSSELFTLAVVALCAGVAVLGALLGLSPALGAFAAGLIVSESIYRHRIMADIMPFKDLFLAIFFVSVGLQIDLGIVMNDWMRILGFSILILIVKGTIAFNVARLFKLPLRPALLTGAALSSSGEFSLVLLGKAADYRPADPSIQQLLLSCAAFTMATVPLLMRGSGHAGRILEGTGFFKPKKKTVGENLTPTLAIKEISDHAIICGYGPVGRSLNEALRQSAVDTLVLELNSDTVRALKAAGQPVLFADASHSEALDLAGISRARMVAFTFPAVELTKAAVPIVREHNPGIVIFARAKFAAEIEELRALEIEVIHDERESAVAMIDAAKGVYQRIDLSDEDVREIVDGKQTPPIDARHS